MHQKTPIDISFTKAMNTIRNAAIIAYDLTLNSQSIPRILRELNYIQVYSKILIEKIQKYQEQEK